jgi:hypothetical protein
MEFFNKKEEVLDVELTEYGKYLLAIGQLNPTYYAFFDDDIQYDVSGSGYTENQNDIANRIQYDTPKLKILANRTSAEKRVRDFLSETGGAIATLSNNSSVSALEDIKLQQPFENKTRLASSPVGNSSLSSPYNASWQLESLSVPEISSSVRYNQTDAGLIENIPQIDITIDYETFFELDSENSGKAITDELGTSGLVLSLNDNYLMIELIENNTSFEKENFELQVYRDRSSTGGPEWEQLSFMNASEITFIAPTTQNVEYYFNALTDTNIPAEVLEELNISRKSLTTGASRLRLNRNLYTTDNEEPC